jgi:hypothetical protein
MCNGNNHPPGCHCGFGPPYPNIGVSIRKLLSKEDRQSSTVAELDLDIPLSSTDYFYLIDIAGKKRILSTTVDALQPLADKRFGTDNIKVVPIYIVKGSIDLGVALVVVAGAAYYFFKDYEDLRKGVIQFTNDITYVSSKLYRIVRKKYLSEERRSVKRKSKESKHDEIRKQ